MGRLTAGNYSKLDKWIAGLADFESVSLFCVSGFTYIDAFDSSPEGVASGQARPDHAEKG